MTKPIVVRTNVPELRDAEYGFETIEDARTVFPEAEIVRYQDGTEYTPPAPKKAPAKKED